MRAHRDAYGKIPTQLRSLRRLLQPARACSGSPATANTRLPIRLGDYLLLGTNHPTRNLKQLRLSDHGCEVINA